MIHKWKLLESEWVLQNKWYNVRKDTLEVRSGRIIDDYYLGVFPNVAIVVAVTPDNMIPLVRQYKHGAEDILTELPAGYMDEGEEPLAAAKRELQEETGYTSDEWEQLTYVLRNPSRLRGDNINIFLARNAQKTTAQALDDNEDIEVMLKPFSEALAMAKSGEIQGIDSVLGLLLAAEKLS